MGILTVHCQWKNRAARKVNFIYAEAKKTPLTLLRMASCNLLRAHPSYMYVTTKKFHARAHWVVHIILVVSREFPLKAAYKWASMIIAKHDILKGQTRLSRSNSANARDVCMNLKNKSFSDVDNLGPMEVISGAIYNEQWSQRVTRISVYTLYTVPPSPMNWEQCETSARGRDYGSWLPGD